MRRSVYLNAFPVAAIKAIYDDPQAFAPNVEFFVDLKPLGTVKSPTVDWFRNPQEVFGDALRAEALVPPPFLAPQGCGRLDGYGRRLTEALDYAALFQAAEDRSAASRQNIQTLLGWRPLIEFWLEVAKVAFPATAAAAICRRLSEPSSPSWPPPLPRPRALYGTQQQYCLGQRRTQVLDPGR